MNHAERLFKIKQLEYKQKYMILIEPLGLGRAHAKWARQVKEINNQIAKLLEDE